VDLRSLLTDGTYASMLNSDGTAVVGHGAARLALNINVAHQLHDGKRKTARAWWRAFSVFVPLASDVAEAPEAEVIVPVAALRHHAEPCQNGARQRDQCSWARMVSQMNHDPFISVTPSVVDPRLAIWLSFRGRFMCSAALPSMS
jgi:hypothetical protein